MKKIPTYKTPCTDRVSSLWTRCALLALTTIAIATSSAFAQTVTMRSQPLRFTIPKGVASSNFCTLTIPISGLVTPGVDTVTLAVTGVPGSGAAATFLSTNGFQSNLTYTATLVLTNDATISPGVYDMAVVATGAASFRLPVPVEVVTVWSGASGTGIGTAGNWIGGVTPGATDKVVFRDTAQPGFTTWKFSAAPR
jgi:hypothetical protein